MRDLGQASRGRRRRPPAGVVATRNLRRSRRARAPSCLTERCSARAFCGGLHISPIRGRRVPPGCSAGDARAGPAHRSPGALRSASRARGRATEERRGRPGLMEGGSPRRRLEAGAIRCGAGCREAPHEPDTADVSISLLEEDRRLGDSGSPTHRIRSSSSVAPSSSATFRSKVERVSAPSRLAAATIIRSENPAPPRR